MAMWTLELAANALQGTNSPKEKMGREKQKAGKQALG